MRKLAVFATLLTLFVVLGLSLATRGQHTPTTRVIPPSRVAVADAGVVADAAVAREGTLGRPLRVVSLGWELAVPGLLANRGLQGGAASEYTASGTTVAHMIASTPAEVEAALARGGADAQGADVALLPLPVMVASYERLRALSPVVFFVTGWTRGREALVAYRRDALTTVPETGDVSITGDVGDTASFVAIEVLGLAGVGPERLRWNPTNRAASESTRGDDDPPRLRRPRGPTSSAALLGPTTTLIAQAREVDERVPTNRQVVLSTADAPRLVPIVAITSAGFASAQRNDLKRWAEGWLSGTRSLRSDPATAAREVSHMEGAPEAVVLLERLGMLEVGTLADNARAMGLAGRGAVNLQTLFLRTWRDWRAAGVLTTPEPDAAPLSTDAVLALVRASPPSPAELNPSPPSIAPTRVGASSRAATVFFTRTLRGTRLDEAALTEVVSWSAALFERATIRVRAQDEAAARRTLDAARTRFDVPEARVQLQRATLPPRVTAVVEVFTGP
jgi:hypothetical protein